MNLSFSKFVLVAAVAGLGFLPALRQAEAAMSFCNKTSGALEAAVGYRSEDPEKPNNWISEGWWRIEPGQCARILQDALAQRFYFYYGRALSQTAKDQPPTVWAGKYIFCTDTKAFKIEGDGDCSLRKFKNTGFQQVDVGAGTRDYTLDFKDGLSK